MVLKKSIAGQNSGNTIRKKYINNFIKTTFCKGYDISNLRFYTGQPSFENIITSITNQTRLYQTSVDHQVQKGFDLLDIRHWIEYVVDRNQELTDGLFARSYIPTSTENYVDELISAIQNLNQYQDAILSGELDLGLDPRVGFDITLTVYEHGDQTDIGRTRYNFTSIVPHNVLLKRDYKLHKASTDHLRNTSQRGIQRKHALGARITYVEPDLEFVNSSDISITIIKNEPGEEAFAIGRTVFKPDGDGREKGHKSFKKSHHQKNKQYAHHHNHFDRKDVEDIIHGFSAARQAYRNRRQQNRRVAEHRFRQQGREIPWIRGPYYIPPGLWPDEAKKLAKKRDAELAEPRRRWEEQQQNNKRRYIEQQKAFRLKRKEERKQKQGITNENSKVNAEGTTDGKQPIVLSRDVFLTEITIADDEFSKQIEKEEEDKKEVPVVKERVTKSIELWEFVDDMLNRCKEEQEIVFRNCELPNSVTDELEVGDYEHSPSRTSSSLHNGNVVTKSTAVINAENNLISDTYSLLQDNNSYSSQLLNNAELNKNEKHDKPKIIPVSAKDNGITRKMNGRKRKKLKLKLLSVTGQNSSATLDKPSEQNDGKTLAIINAETLSKETVKKGTLEVNTTKARLKDNMKNVTTEPLQQIKRPRVKDSNYDFIESLSDFRLPGMELKVKSSSLRPSYLMKKYGNNYQEASLFPRVFSIDISDRLMDVVPLFRKEEPFSKPFATLILRLCHGSSEELVIENNVSFTLARLFVKADMEINSVEDLHHRLKEKMKYNLIYPIAKVVDDFVQTYKILPYPRNNNQIARFLLHHIHQSGMGKNKMRRIKVFNHSRLVYISYAMPKIVPVPSLKASERVRSQLDWLYTLCQWKFKIYSAVEAYSVFSQCVQTFNSLPRPTTASLCRLIETTPNMAIRSCDIPSCQNIPDVLFVSCQHAICRDCIEELLIGDICDKEIPLSCWVPGCKTVLDQVTLTYLLSLPLFKLQQVYAQNKKIGSHPLWQWCPQKGCGRVVKLSGSGFLDSGVVIVCDCGSVWCFHCKKEGHWPASCNQYEAYLHTRKQDYKQFQKGSSTPRRQNCEVTRVYCEKCCSNLSSEDLAIQYLTSNSDTIINSARMDARVYFNDKTRKNMHIQTQLELPNSEKDDSGFDEDSLLSLEDQTCKCQYEVCWNCLNSEETSIKIPKTFSGSEEESLSVETSQSILLPLLYYQSALVHRREKELWSWSSVEIHTSKILKTMRRSPRIASSYSHQGTTYSVGEDTTTCSYISNNVGITGDKDSLITDGGTSFCSPSFATETSIMHLPKTRAQHRPKTGGLASLAPTLETEKFFLITVHQFVQQTHVLLEYVYVSLMSPEMSKKLPNVVPLAIGLESIAIQIRQNLSSLKFNSLTFTHLHKLLDAGNKIIVKLTNTLKNCNGSNSLMNSKEPTFFKSNFSKLPPIGQKMKVKFLDGNEKCTTMS